MFSLAVEQSSYVQKAVKCFFKYDFLQLSIIMQNERMKNITNEEMLKSLFFVQEKEIC